MRPVIRWGIHGLEKNALRNIRTRHVLEIIEQNDVIATTDGKHGARRVYLGKFEGRSIHVVIDVDRDETEYYIVSVYVPDPKLWKNGYRERRT